MISPYPARRQRAIELLGTALPAEEILGFLIGLMEVQSVVFDWAASQRVWNGVRRADAGGPPCFDLGRLELAPMVPQLQRFAAGVSPIATDVLSQAASVIANASHDPLQRALGRFLAHQGLSDNAATMGVEEAPLTFFSRAFLQPVVETVRRGDEEVDAPAHRSTPEGRSCPACGHPPLVSIFRDEGDKKNARYLCCSLCAEEWPFPRLTCALCGETESKALLHHTSDSLPHIRVDECRSCRGYLKAIDLRKMGSAIPIIDEIAAIELDLWATQRNLEKGRQNLLGF